MHPYSQRRKTKGGGGRESKRDPGKMEGGLWNTYTVKEMDWEGITAFFTFIAKLDKLH